VRHGETEWNREHRSQGLSDIELNEVGRKQAEAIAKALQNEPIETIYTSPLRRASETAKAIARCHQAEVVILDGLKELDLGYIDGLSPQEMKRDFSQFWEEWVKDPAVTKLPGGETLLDLQERAWSSVQEIIEKQCNGVVAIVSHYFAILSIIYKALGLNLSNLRRLKLDIGSISILEYGERGFMLRIFNDTCHLGEFDR
jgi:broad specificity phosphatase PhoE